MNTNKTDSSENDDLQRFYRAMAILRQKIETLLKSTPELLKINNLAELPSEKAEIVEDQLWDIFVYGEYYVEKLIADCSGEPIVSASEAGKEHFDYHQKQYKSFSRKITGLIDVLNAPERKKFEQNFVRRIDVLNATDSDWRYPTDPSLAGCAVNSIDDEKYSQRYERYALNGFLWKFIKSIAKGAISLEEIGDDILPDSNSNKNHHIENFRTIGECADLYIERLDYELQEVWADRLNLVDYRKIIEKPYFEPDNWIANEKELFPVIVNRELKQIPQPIQERIREIHSSFIFGNWMSVIALSRCLLEYAIIDRKSLLEKRLDREIAIHDDKGYTIKLRTLVSIAEEAFPKLGENMDFIVEQGNYILHDTKVKPILSSMDNAKKCIDGITTIISTLYSKPKNSGNPCN